MSERLRRLRENRRLTTQAMSDATGIPKHTLESYMLKENAAQPGLDALKHLSGGLGVSLDWLIFGEGRSAGRTGSIAGGSATSSKNNFGRV